MAKTLNLHFPQWQGSSLEDAVRLYYGSAELYKLLNHLPFESIAVDTDSKDDTVKGINHFSSIVRQAEQVSALLHYHQPQRVFTLGGDCGVDFLPISYLNERYGKTFAVVWLDAHADLHTPNSSPSGAFHGMVLRHILGQGSEALRKLAARPLYTDQVYLAGVRHFDAPELAYYEENRIKLFRVSDLEERPEVLTEVLEVRGYKHLHIHLDLDVLEPSEFRSVGFPVAGGLKLAAAVNLLTVLKSFFEVVGVSVTEYMPTAETDKQVLSTLLLSNPLV